MSFFLKVFSVTLFDLGQSLNVKSSLRTWERGSVTVKASPCIHCLCRVFLIITVIINKCTVLRDRPRHRALMSSLMAVGLVSTLLLDLATPSTFCSDYSPENRNINVNLKKAGYLCFLLGLLKWCIFLHYSFYGPMKTETWWDFQKYFFLPFESLQRFWLLKPFSVWWLMGCSRLQ